MFIKPKLWSCVQFHKHLQLGNRRGIESKKQVQETEGKKASKDTFTKEQTPRLLKKKKIKFKAKMALKN